MDDIIRQWSTFLDNCLTRRISADRFAAAAAQLHAKSPLPGPKIATLLLRPRSANVSGYDVHTVDYSERLLALKKLDTSDILASAFRYSKDWVPRPGDKSPVKDAPWNNPPGLDEVIFHRLSKSFQAEERPLDSNEGFGTLLVMTRWMQAMVTSHTNDNMIKAITGMQTGIQHQPQQQSINVHEGLGVLVIGVVENPKMIRILNHPKCVGKSFSSTSPPRVR
jgi:mediator of RNA polymerase II transcription subunit 5